MHMRDGKSRPARRPGVLAAMVLGVWAIGTLLAPSGAARAADEQISDEQLQLIVQFLSDPDRETRAIGLQYVRDEVPGQTATERFVDLLGELATEAQADLVEALGERGDAAARPAILERAEGSDPAVRAAALRALAGLGTAADVALLASKAADGSEAERNAARRSLAQLRGDDVDPAIIAALDGAGPGVQIELIGVLAARNAKPAFPALMELAEAPQADVRLAVLDAIRYLADEDHVSDLVGVLKTAGTEAERRRAELALLVTCSRGRQACVEPLIDGLDQADVPSRIALVRALARAGGAEAMKAILVRLDDHDQSVRDEAVRMLSGWPGPEAIPHLKTLAADPKNLRHQVLAIRGLVRLAGAQGEKPGDAKMLAEALTLATRPQEKCWALGSLGNVPTPESLGAAVAALDDPAVSEEAGLAAVRIAENLDNDSRDNVQAAMKQVIQRVRNQNIRDRAQKVLGTR